MLKQFLFLLLFLLSLTAKAVSVHMYINCNDWDPNRPAGSYQLQLVPQWQQDPTIQGKGVLHLEEYITDGLPGSGDFPASNRWLNRNRVYYYPDSNKNTIIPDTLTKWNRIFPAGFIVHTAWYWVEYHSPGVTDTTWGQIMRHSTPQHCTQITLDNEVYMTPELVTECFGDGTFRLNISFKGLTVLDGELVIKAGEKKLYPGTLDVDFILPYTGLLDVSIGTNSKNGEIFTHFYALEPRNCPLSYMVVKEFYTLSGQLIRKNYADLPPGVYTYKLSGTHGKFGRISKM